MSTSLTTAITDPTSALDTRFDANEAESLAALLKVLADPARIRLISILATSPTGEVCACELPAALGRSQPTTSHHLRQLLDAGLIEREQRGKWAWFKLRAERLAAIRMALDDMITASSIVDAGKSDGVEMGCCQ